ncbi:MAG: helix-turn-helix transcriptional regulator [Verrucomicrobiota bacterium]
MNTENEKKTAAKPTGRKYASVAELMRVEGVSQEVQTHFNEIVNATRVVHQLAHLRHIAGLTQEEMADRLRVTQSAVSKLESGRDEDLTLGQIREYAKASSERICVVFGKPLNHVEAVKVCANGMRHHLSALASLAHNGEEMEREIQAFFGEAFFNILSLLSASQNEMPNSQKIEVRMQLMEPPRAKRNLSASRGSTEMAQA